MKVKLINEALRRIVIPADVDAEGFKAGARALAYEFEKDTTPVAFTDELSANICKVFDNEEAFLAEFFPVGTAVDEFYMASGQCRVVFQPKYTTTIKTADFLAWAEGLQDES